MTHTTCTVIENTPVSSNYFELTLAWSRALPQPAPGSFLTARVSHSSVPLLRRPFAFSFFDANRDAAGLLYERRGTATQQLSSCRAGDEIDILGPLGVPFPQPAQSARPVLVAGGIGMGPIFFLASSLAVQHANRNPAATEPPLLIVGARTADLIPERPEFQQVETIIATDDGSAGVHGTVIDALNEYPRALDSTLEFFGCGPTPMLKAVHELAAERGERMWASVEQTMGCAVGACMGCTVRVHGGNGYARVCTEGPVFDSRELQWT